MLANMLNTVYINDIQMTRYRLTFRLRTAKRAALEARLASLLREQAVQYTADRKVA